jgi:hypothetical protein
MISLFLVSCEKYQDEVLPVVGVYEANVLGVGGPFSISISVDYGDNLLIEAPWDGEVWDLVEANLQNEFDFKKFIRIRDQRLADGVRIWGEGVFYDYTIQLDYTIRIEGVSEHYTIVGTKL